MKTIMRHIQIFRSVKGVGVCRGRVYVWAAT